jgi:SNF family Na+-dependent transporter
MWVYDISAVHVSAGLLIMWVACYFGTFRSVRSIAAATKFTLLASWFIMAVLVIHNATLESSGEGVRAYIGEWDLETLKRGEPWADAAGQVFYSLSVTFGTPRSSLYRL